MAYGRILLKLKDFEGIYATANKKYSPSLLNIFMQLKSLFNAVVFAGMTFKKGGGV